MTFFPLTILWRFRPHIDKIESNINPSSRSKSHKLPALLLDERYQNEGWLAFSNGIKMSQKHYESV